MVARSRKVAVLVAAAATLFTTLASSEYTYQAAPCLTTATRQFSPTDGLSYTNEHSCASTAQTLGVAGSSSLCTRSWTVLVIQFLLPQINSSSVTGVSFSATVSDPGGGGLPVILHGLGARSLDRSGASTTFHGGYPMNADYGYPLSESDYYCGNGAADPASGSVLINDAFGAASLADGTALTEDSEALRDYIRAQLDAAAPNSQTYTALRIGSDAYYGKMPPRPPNHLHVHVVPPQLPMFI